MAQPPPENLPEMLLTEDDPRFSPDEMLNCDVCGRSIPPNRTSCIYCGKPLSTDVVNAEIARINFQQPEAWQDGFSLVYSGQRELNTETIASASNLIQIESAFLEELLAVSAPMPLIYLKSLPDANLLASRLSEIGFDCAIVGDDLLQAKTPPTRVRSMIFENDSVLFEDFNNCKFSRVSRNERVLIVTGTLIKTSTETAGKFKKGVIKADSETLSSTDETVIDIYPPSDVYGFRIRTSGFDFSCLGDRMRPIAAANITTLISEMRDQFADGVFIDSFQVVEPLLDTIWPTEESTQSGGVSRSAFSGVRKASTTVIDNTTQFTKFSRLQRHFI